MSDQHERVARAICRSGVNCIRFKQGRDDGCAEVASRPCEATRVQLTLCWHWTTAAAAIRAYPEPTDGADSNPTKVGTQ